MFRYNIVLPNLLLLIAILLTPTSLAFATNNEDGFNFQMNPVLPENQINKRVSYFDLKVSPGIKQNLSLSVVNNGKKIKKIRITPSNAETNQEGSIIYTSYSDKYQNDKTLKYHFNTLIKEEAKTVTIKPGEVKLVTFNLELPKKKFNGVILGAFTATLLDEKKNRNKSGISSSLQIIKPVVLRESEKKIVPEFKINQVVPAFFNFQKAVTVNLENSSPTIINGAEIHVDIFKLHSEVPISSASKRNVKMAPYSSFDFPVIFDENTLKAGEYFISVKITYSNKIQKFSKKFNISENDIYGLEKKSSKASPKSNYFKFFIIGGVALLLFIITILWIYFYKFRR